MEAALLEDTEQIAVRQRDESRPEAGEVMLRVYACGICGTDQHIYHGMPGSAQATLPRILGHEFAGEIIALGEGTDTAGFKVGDRVTVDPNIPCGLCSFCRDGRAHLCDHLSAVGVTRDGAMAELCVVPVRNCYHLPDQLSYEDGALIEPLGCALHGFQQLMIRPGSSVLIVGGGFIGQLMIQLARMAAPSQLLVSEPDQQKRELARELGATATFDPRTETFEALLTMLNGGADITIECVGRAETMDLAVRAARKGGQVLLFGVAAPDTTIPLTPFEVFRKELTIRGSFVNPATHAEAIALAAQGIVKLSALVSHRWTLEELPAVMRDYPTLGVTKGLVIPN